MRDHLGKHWGWSWWGVGNCVQTVVFCEREWTRQRKQVWDWLMGLGAVPHC